MNRKTVVALLFPLLLAVPPPIAATLTADQAVPDHLRQARSPVQAEASCSTRVPDSWSALFEHAPTRVSADASRSGGETRESSSGRANDRGYSGSYGVSGSWGSARSLELGVPCTRPPWGERREVQPRRDGAQIVLDTKRQFYEVVKAMHLARVSSDARRRRVRALYEMGSVSSDLLKARVRTSQSELRFPRRGPASVTAQLMRLATRTGMARPRSATSRPTLQASKISRRCRGGGCGSANAPSGREGRRGSSSRAPSGALRSRADPVPARYFAERRLHAEVGLELRLRHQRRHDPGSSAWAKGDRSAAFRSEHADLRPRHREPHRLRPRVPAMRSAWKPATRSRVISTASADHAARLPGVTWNAESSRAPDASNRPAKTSTSSSRSYNVGSGEQSSTPHRFPRCGAARARAISSPAMAAIRVAEREADPGPRPQRVTRRKRDP